VSVPCKYKTEGETNVETVNDEGLILRSSNVESKGLRNAGRSLPEVIGASGPAMYEQKR
jgi:hypothetical protein